MPMLCRNLHHFRCIIAANEVKNLRAWPAAWVARRWVGGTGPRYEANNNGPAVPGVAFKPAFSPSFFRVSELETICDSMVGRARSGHCMQPVAYRILSK